MSTPSQSAADLPADVLQSIQSLLPLFDYLRFPAVCASWRNAARHNPRPPQPDKPCLFYIRRRGLAVACQFSPQKIHQMPIPKPFRRHGIVSAAEHHLIVRDRGSKLKEMYILNPFSWTEIGCLPSPLPSLQAYAPAALNPLLFPRRSRTTTDDDAIPCLRRIATDGNFAVAVWGHELTCLAYACLVSDRWTEIRGSMDDSANRFVDVVPSRLQKGLFYAVRRQGCLWKPWVMSFDLSSSTSSVARTDITMNLVRDFVTKNPLVGNDPKTRLIVSSSDLYVVRWAMIREATGIVTRRIDVYQLPLLGNAEEQRRWIRPKSLGGCSFFLGPNQSICVSTAEFPQLRGDRIFLLRHSFQHPELTDSDEIEQLKYESVYNLQDGSWECLYGALEKQSYGNVRRMPVWILPRLV